MPIKAAAGKPSESKKLYKKHGGNESMVVQIMFKAYIEANKKAGMSK
jgi:hypothetical protein